MNTSQLECIISCDHVLRGRVLGVFAADQLPRTIRTFPCGFIANTDISSRAGQHWLAFFMRDDNVVECFDSYGQNPGVYNGLFMTWIHRHAKNVLLSERRLQKKVQVGKDQEKAQSEKDSHSKNRGGKKTKLTVRYLYHETYRDRMSSYFPNRWPLSYLNLTKNMKTYIRRQQHKKFFQTPRHKTTN